MFNAISDGISIKLNSVFGDGYEISSEDIKQGFVAPCFFIKPLPTTSKALLGKRKRRDYQFVITYFPKEGNEEMMKVSEQMLDALACITLVSGETLRALTQDSPMESEIVDGVLHVTVKYAVFFNDLSREESMDDLKYSGGLKGA